MFLIEFHGSTSRFVCRMASAFKFGSWENDYLVSAFPVESCTEEEKCKPIWTERVGFDLASQWIMAAKLAWSPRPCACFSQQLSKTLLQRPASEISRNHHRQKSGCAQLLIPLSCHLSVATARGALLQPRPDIGTIAPPAMRRSCQMPGSAGCVARSLRHTGAKLETGWCMFKQFMGGAALVQQ